MWSNVQMPSDVCSSKFVLHLLLLHCKLNSELMVSPKNIVGVNDDKWIGDKTMKFHGMLN